MSLLLGGPELIKFLAALAIFHQDDLMKKMNKITFTGRNGCFYKMDDQPVHTTPNHHAPKVVVLSKLFFKSSLRLKWLVRHSSNSLKPPAAMTFAFSSVFILLLWSLLLYRTPGVWRILQVCVCHFVVNDLTRKSRLQIPVILTSCILEKPEFNENQRLLIWLIN